MSAEEIIGQLDLAEQLIYTNQDYRDQVIDQTISIGMSTDLFKVKLKAVQIIHTAFFYKKLEDFDTRVNLSYKLVPFLKYMIIDTNCTQVLIISKSIDVFSAIYDLLFLFLIKNPNLNTEDVVSFQLWREISSLKEFIISQWPSSYPLLRFNYEVDTSRSIAVKISTIKLISTVIKTHYPSINSSDDDGSEDISLSLVSSNHPFLYNSNLDMEAQDLLEMLFKFLNDDILIATQLFSTIITVMLNLFKLRPNLMNAKFINYMLAYESQLKRIPRFEDEEKNKLKTRLLKRFNDKLDRIAINFLLNKGFLNKDPSLKSRFEAKAKYLDEKFKSLKSNGILNDINDVEDDDVKELKKRRLNASNFNNQEYFYNNSTVARDADYKSLYTLIDPSEGLINFDVSELPLNTLKDMVITAINNCSLDKLGSALDIVYKRYDELSKRLYDQEHGGQEHDDENDEDDDNDDEDNNGLTVDGMTGIKNEYDDGDDDDYEDDLQKESYKNPLPGKFDDFQKSQHLKIIINNFMKVAQKPIQTSTKESTEPSDSNGKEIVLSTQLNKVAITSWNNDSWMTLLIRMATRGSLNTEISKQIRESLFDYFKQDLKKRLNGVIEWLNEEYYDYQVKLETEPDLPNGPETYLYYCNQVMDYFIAFLEPADRKIFLQLLSEIPYLNKELVWKIKSLCFDPARSQLGIQSLVYLLLFRPPAFDDCIALLEEISDEAGKSGNTSLKDKCDKSLEKYKKK